MAEFDYPSLCGISARVRESFVVEGKGCCHDSVKEIVDQLFSRERGVFSKMSKERVSSIKQEMSREVSLECMETDFKFSMELSALGRMTPKFCLKLIIRQNKFCFVMYFVKFF